jgi:hypothetical protein
MKGNPALQTVLVLLLLAAVYYPVSRVISHGEHPVKSPFPTAARQLPCLPGTLRIRTAPPPLRLGVTSGKKVVLDAKETTGQGEFAAELFLPPGSDLLIRAEWGDDRPHALRAEFLPSGTNGTVSRDYWSGRVLEDVLTLP